MEGQRKGPVTVSKAGPCLGPLVSGEEVVCTQQAMSSGSCKNGKHPEFGNIFVCMFSPPHPPMPTRAGGDPSVPRPHVLPMNSLAAGSTSHWLPGRQKGQAACHRSPVLFLAQILKLDKGLVALEAEGQELLLELEKNQ